jgi:hypothetical protein
LGKSGGDVKVEQVLRIGGIQHLILKGSKHAAHPGKDLDYADDKQHQQLQQIQLQGDDPVWAV